MADKIANALVSSHLDYCNSLFRSLFFFNMLKLQYIQNTLGRIVTNCNRYSRATPILKPLHWLPVGFCKTCFIQMRDVRWVRQYLTDEAGVLAANIVMYLYSAQYLHILQDSKALYNQSNCTGTAPTQK